MGLVILGGFGFAFEAGSHVACVVGFRLPR